MTPTIALMVAALVSLASFSRGISLARCAGYGIAVGAAFLGFVWLVG